MPRTVTLEEYLEHEDHDAGYCTTCEDFETVMVEPDAREYPCPVCGEDTVYGAQEALLMGLLEVV